MDGPPLIIGAGSRRAEEELTMTKTSISKTPVAVLEIDLGKNSCSLAGLDTTGAVVLRRRMTREGLIAFVAKLPTRPTMRLATLKSEAQLDLQILHRARQRLVTARTRLTNQLRAVLLERGIILLKRRTALRQRLDDLMSEEMPISARAVRLLEDLRDEWANVDRRIRAYDDELAALTRDDDKARTLATIPGIGVINATALLAAVGDASSFARGRDLAAWLGLTPRQHSAGGRTRLLGISKRGNRYLRATDPWRSRCHGALRQAGYDDGRVAAPTACESASQRRDRGARRQAGAHRMGRVEARTYLRASGRPGGLTGNSGRHSADAAHDVCGGEGQMA